MLSINRYKRKYRISEISISKNHNNTRINKSCNKHSSNNSTSSTRQTIKPNQINNLINEIPDNHISNRQKQRSRITKSHFVYIVNVKLITYFIV